MAGVSVMSVSRVCDPNYGGQISPEMRQKVAHAIETLGYRPDYVARSLRKGRTDTIGFYYGYRGLMHFNDDFTRRVFIGLQDELTNLSQDLLIYNVPESPRLPAEIVRDVGMSKVDGVVFLPEEGDEEIAHLFSESYQNFVAIVESMPGIPSITAQDADGSIRLAQHLYERGHRHIMYRKSRLRLTSASRRFDAFSDAARDLGMRITATTTDLLNDEISGEEVQIIREVGARGITAIVGWHDLSAIRAAIYSRTIGLDIPGDIAVAGFDRLSHSITPRGLELTTIIADWQEIARRGVDYIVKGKDAVRVEHGDLVRDNDGVPEIQVCSPLFLGNTT